MMRRLVSIIVLALALGVLTPNAQQQAYSPITQQDLLQGLRNPSRWLTFSGDYTGQRHSPLKQLTPQNVAGLVPQWIFQTDMPGLPGRGLENTPLVVDGILYVTGNNNQAWAIDGRTGRSIWTRLALRKNACQTTTAARTSSRRRSIRTGNYFSCVSGSANAVKVSPAVGSQTAQVSWAVTTAMSPRNSIAPSIVRFWSAAPMRAR